MKLYDFGPAASAKRVRIFLHEKGIQVPTVELDVRDGAQYKEPFTTMNPFHCVPFLELDNGTVIAESISICRYLEELNPTPSLFGQNSEERAVIDMWNRRVELDGFYPALHAARNSTPMFKGRVVPGTRTDIEQSPAVVQRGKEMLEIFFGRLDPHLSDNAFIAGAKISIADITCFFATNMATAFEMDLEGKFPNTYRWHQEFSARPSTEA